MLPQYRTPHYYGQFAWCLGKGPPSVLINRVWLLAGSFAGYQLGNTTSDGNVVLAGASLLGTSILESHLGDAEHSTMESPLRPMEEKEPELLEIERKEQLFREQRARRQRREREERELWEAESLQQQQESITARSQWLCEHYQRHCNVQFPCCTQFYPCHRCHNISRACENEEAKACHATHLKCSYCQHEQEVIFYSHFTLLELMGWRHGSWDCIFLYWHKMGYTQLYITFSCTCFSLFSLSFQ